MAWSNQNQEAVELIAGDRRQDRRYALHLDCRWKLIRRRRVLDSGTGNTVDLSSGGLLFDAGRHLPAGLNVELSVNWPVLLHNVAPLQLVVTGKIVRSNGRLAAVRTIQHEFRTVGSATETKPATNPVSSRNPQLLASPAIFASLGKMP